jgi:hypothetical protein
MNLEEEIAQVCCDEGTPDEPREARAVTPKAGTRCNVMRDHQQ